MTNNLPFEGKAHITGEPDTGKSTLCISVPGVQPGEYIIFDDDEKTETVAEALKRAGTPFGYYVNLQRASKARKMNRPADFYRLVVECMAEARKTVPSARVAVFDNMDRIEAALRAQGLTQLKEFSDLSEGQASKMSSLTWPATRTFYTQWLDSFQELAPLVFFTTHLRDKYIRNTKVEGMQEAKGQLPLIEKCHLRLWLRHNANGPAPIGLVLKRIMHMAHTPDGLKPVNVFPRRLDPCDWPTIVGYLNNPIGERAPTKKETPTAFELSILDGELTADQKESWRVARKLAETDPGDAEMLPGENPPAELDERTLQIKEMGKAGAPPPKIASELGIPIAEVLEALAK